MTPTGPLFWIFVLANLIAFFWLVIVGFRRHWGWGLAVFFVPFALLVFAIMYWEDAKKPFLVYLVTTIVIVYQVVNFGMMQGEALLQQAVDPLQKRFNGERLRHIGICTGLEATFDVLGRRQNCQRQDGHVVLCPDASAQLPAVYFRHADVQDDEVGVFLIGQQLSPGWFVAGNRGVPLLGEHLGQELGNCWVIVYNQNFLFTHGLSSLGFLKVHSAA